MAEKKIILTLQRVYKKEIEVDVSDSRFDGMSDEEIADILMNEDIIDEDIIGNLFADASFDEFDNVEGDRYDIYEGNRQVYGGHL